MAKTKPADNRFTPGEQYLARIIVARWTSLPTIVPNEYGLAIQVKLSVICTAPPVGDPIFCGSEAVIYITVRMDTKTPTEVGISPTPRRFLDDLGINWSQYPSDGYPLQHNENAIFCEFGNSDPVNGYQSICKWKLAPVTITQNLIAQASQGSVTITGLGFPSELWVSRGKIPPVKLSSILQWHALRAFAQSNHYKGTDLVKHVWSIVGKPAPETAKINDTVTKLISKLRQSIKCLYLDIVSDWHGNYTLVDHYDHNDSLGQTLSDSDL